MYPKRSSGGWQEQTQQKALVSTFRKSSNFRTISQVFKLQNTNVVCNLFLRALMSKLWARLPGNHGKKQFVPLTLLYLYVFIFVMPVIHATALGARDEDVLLKSIWETSQWKTTNKSHPLLEAHSGDITSDSCILLMAAAQRLLVEGTLCDGFLKSRTLHFIHMDWAHALQKKKEKKSVWKWHYTKYTCRHRPCRQKGNSVENCNQWYAWGKTFQQFYVVVIIIYNTHKKRFAHTEAYPKSSRGTWLI